MRNNDLEVGRGTLALMAQNTQNIGQTRLQGWQMLGAGLKDASNQALNLWQLTNAQKQQKKDNDFKESQFNFAKAQAERETALKERQLNTQERQFNARQRLDELNSATDRAYKQAQINALNSQKGGQSVAFDWELAEALKRKYIENPATMTLQELDYLKKAGFDDKDTNGIALKTRALHESITNTDKLLRNASELYDKADEIKGVGYGIRRGLNKASLGFIGLNPKQNEFLTETTNLVDAFIKERYANQTSAFKEAKARELLDEALASPAQFKARLQALSKDILAQQMERTNTLREFGASNEYFKRLEEKNEAYKAKFGSDSNATKPSLPTTPTSYTPPILSPKKQDEIVKKESQKLSDNAKKWRSGYYLPPQN